MDCKSQKSCHW